MAGAVICKPLNLVIVVRGQRAGPPAGARLIHNLWIPLNLLSFINKQI